jgi:intergrase/recombinase
LNPRPPPCEDKKRGQNNLSFQNRSLKKYYIQNRSLYIRYLENRRQIQPRKALDYTSSLDRNLTHIKDIKQLNKNLEEKYTDTYGRALKNLFNFMEYQEIEEFNGIDTEKWKKKIKLRPSGIREIYISDKEVKEAYQKISRDYKIIFKLLVYSGMRLTQILRGIENIDNAIGKDRIARIPIGSISKGKKQGFWIYLPLDFFNESKECNLKYCYYTYLEKMRIGRVSASTIRKWNYNFLIENRVTESIADFIQGRASTTVGSAHYLNKTIQADREYARIADKFVSILS